MSDVSHQGDKNSPGRTPDRGLVSIAEAATRLGVSKMTIRRRIQSKTWPSGRCGKKHLLPLSFVEGAVAAIESGCGIDLDEFAATFLARFDDAEAVA